MMGRKLTEGQSKYLIYQYRWSFLRLWEDYQKDFDHWKTIKNRKDPIPKRVAEVRKDIISRYGINEPYDYHKEKIPVRIEISGERPEIEFAVCEGPIKNYETVQEVKLIRCRKMEIWEGKKELRSVSVLIPRYLQLVVNLNADFSDIENEFKKIVKEKQEKRSQYFSFKRNYRLTLDIYDRYLQIYKLRQLEGYSNKKVAKKIYPAEFKDSQRSAEDKVSKAFLEAKSLVNGGYRKIFL